MASPRRTRRCSSTGATSSLEEVDKQGEILVNGKKKRRARLVHGDRLTLGDVSLSFSMFDEPARSSSGGQAPATLSDTSLNANQQLAGFRKLYEFSEKLMTMTEIEPLLEAMLDAVIEVTGAEKGLILLNDDAFMTGPKPASAPPAVDAAAPRRGARIRAARNVNRDAVADAAGAISDSIVRARSSRPAARSSSATPSATRSPRAARACWRSSSRA